MRPIHELSSIATLSEMDLFSVPSTQISVSNTQELEYRPISTLKPEIPLEFQIQTSPDQYILLSETYLRMKIKLVLRRNGTDLTATTEYVHLVPEQYLLHSMIKSVEITLGNKALNLSPSSYNYRAYLEALLGYNQDAKNSHLGSALWDTPAFRTATFQPSTNGNYPEVELMGRLHLDLTHQNRAILGGLPLKVKIMLHEPNAFCQTGDVNRTVRMEILACSLLVTSQEATSHLVQAHAKALRMAPAKYPITRSEVRHAILPAGLKDAVMDNLIMGQIPRRLFVVMLRNEVYNGSYVNSAYKFEHFDVNFIATYLNGIQIPAIPYTPDFSKNLYTREFLSLYRNTDQNGTSANAQISIRDFKENHPIFAFNYSPDLSHGYDSNGHVSPIKHGSLRLQMRFTSALTVPINVLLFAEYDNILEVDEMRNVYTDYN